MAVFLPASRTTSRAPSRTITHRAGCGVTPHRADRCARADARSARPAGACRSTTGGVVTAMAQVAIFDVDGTLMDTNYHHALAWSRALLRYDLSFPVWQLHRAIGMGG